MRSQADGYQRLPQLPRRISAPMVALIIAAMDAELRKQPTTDERANNSNDEIADDPKSGALHPNQSFRDTRRPLQMISDLFFFVLGCSSVFLQVIKRFILISFVPFVYSLLHSLSISDKTISQKT
jgi:hypothetical protein